MNLLQKLTKRHTAVPTSWDAYQSWIASNGWKFPAGSYPVEIQGDLGAAAAAIDQLADVSVSNPIVSAAVAKRSKLFSQWRPLWMRPDNTTFTDERLAPIQRPRNMKLPTFLDLVQQHDSYYGTAYVYRHPDGATLLRPDLMQVVLQAPDGADLNDGSFGWLPEAQINGYVMTNRYGDVIRRFTTDEVTRFYSDPDPVAWWRGRSWITSLLRDIQNDGQATDYISNFFANGAVPSMIYTFAPETTQDSAKQFKQMFLEENSGLVNMHKPQFIGGGADVTVVGSDLGRLALRDVTGAHETRIAMRAEMPAIVLGARESLAGSSLTTGNYEASRKQWSQLWGAPYLDMWSCAIQQLLSTPGGANSGIELSYDPKKIRFFQMDEKAEAERIHTDGSTVSLLVRDGWDWESAVSYVISGDIRRLEHTGLLPVQVHPPSEVGTFDDAPEATDNQDSAEGGDDNE